MIIIIIILTVIVDAPINDRWSNHRVILNKESASPIFCPWVDDNHQLLQQALYLHCPSLKTSPVFPTCFIFRFKSVQSTYLDPLPTPPSCRPLVNLSQASVTELCCFAILKNCLSCSTLELLNWGTRIAQDLSKHILSRLIHIVHGLRSGLLGSVQGHLQFSEDVVEMLLAQLLQAQMLPLL